MPNIYIDEYTTEYQRGLCKAIVRTSDQYVTVYSTLTDHPIGTLTRRSSFDRAKRYEWSLYDLDGVLLDEANLPGLLLRRFDRKLGA